MVMVKDLTQIKLADLWKEVKEEEDWWGDVRSDTRSLVKRLLEGTMEEEIIAQLQAVRYGRVNQRRSYRNGYRYRSLLTEFGLLDGIQVPRDRDGIYQPGVIERYQRRQAGVNRAVREMFLNGVSTRKVQDVLEPLLGERVSAQTVSRITRILDVEVHRFRERRLEDCYQYLFLDGIWLKVKGGTEAKKRLVLCAYGITVDGRRELISFRQGTAESEAQWEGFLRDVYQRGLEGKGLYLVSTDGCAGLHRALDTVYPYVARQRCWAHKLRNIANKVRRKNENECLLQAKSIYQAETRREAVAIFRTWSRRWQLEEPTAVRCLEEDLEELLAFLSCQKSHWKKIRTTNVIERAFREVRRRTRPMTCFQNPASVDRIVYGVISHLNKTWKEKPLPEFTHNT
jgi:putative transposase